MLLYLNPLAKLGVMHVDTVRGVVLAALGRGCARPAEIPEVCYFSAAEPGKGPQGQHLLMDGTTVAGACVGKRS